MIDRPLESIVHAIETLEIFSKREFIIAENSGRYI